MALSLDGQFFDKTMSYDSIPSTGATSTTPTNATSAATDMAVASAGIQIVSSIASSIAQVDAFKAQVEADTKNRIANMNNVMDSYEYSAYKLEEAYQNIDSQFSDKVSERLVKSMKDVATARLMSAESGASVGDVQSGLMADEMFDVAVINASKRNALLGITSQAEEARMNAVNKVKSLASGGTNIRANSMVSALAGASNSLGSLLATMPDTVKMDLFSFNTQGTNVDIAGSR